MYKRLIKPVLFGLDAETAHDAAVFAGKKVSEWVFAQKLTRFFFKDHYPHLGKNLMGLNFPNPVGIAAGFDKNGHLPVLAESIGCGFIEVGSVTAQASAGNPKPRAFRLPQDSSLINRMGLNNDGVDVVVERLKKQSVSIPVGLNIAKTHNPEIIGDKAIEDYQYSYKKVQEVADYITINISCPNTKEGKTFETAGSLKELLQALNPSGIGIPTLVKFGADLQYDILKKMIEISEDFGISGYVATNTSTGRENLKTDRQVVQAIGNGGLSGKAIAGKSTLVIRQIAEITEKKKIIIGVGGIDSPESAFEKIRAGAQLLQVYSGMVFRGPGLVSEINRALEMGYQLLPWA